MKGIIFLVVGPTAVGKNTLINRMLSILGDNAVFSISVTTRKPREGEVYGREYFFISEDEFLTQINEGKFIEYAQVGNRYYGTLEDVVRLRLDSDKIVFMDLDVSGAKQIKDSAKARGWKVFDVFILPPKIEMLEERIRKRNGGENEEEIQSRLKRAETEIDHASDFSFQFVNGDPEKCVKGMLKKFNNWKNK